MQRTLIRPPEGQIGPLTPQERATLMQRSPVSGKYDTPVDRESAHELLAKRAEELARKEEELKADADTGGWLEEAGRVVFGRGPRGGASIGEQAARYASRSIMRRVISQIVRSAMKGFRFR